MASKPAHVLGDSLGRLTLDETPQYAVRVRNTLSPSGYTVVHVPAQYVLVGDELEDLYDGLDEDDDFNEYLHDYYEGVTP